ncbi:hypothetical protein COOONC_09231 [Cooperia oncophora]
MARAIQKESENGRRTVAQLESLDIAGIGSILKEEADKGRKCIFWAWSYVRYLKYIALPDVRVYSGTDRDYSWDSFMEAFLLKYPRHSWSCKELKMLLKSKLSGKAKAQYEALPREVRHGSFEGIMAALSRANKEDDQTKKVLALGKLRRLKKLETQTIAEYCVELERLSAKAYPELDEVTLSTVRAHQLYEQVVHWPESYYFMEAMEKDGGTAYASLKQAAMRVERRRLTLENVKEQHGRRPAVRQDEVRSQRFGRAETLGTMHEARKENAAKE